MAEGWVLYYAMLCFFGLSHFSFFFFFFSSAVDNYCVNFCAILTPAGGLLIFLLFLTWCFYASLIIVN